MIINIDPTLEKKFNNIIGILGLDTNTVVEKLISDYVDNVIKSMNQVISEKPTINRPTPSAYKAINRIEMVAHRKKQLNHWILKAFFMCENNGTASKEAMRNYFIKYTGNPNFETNFVSMQTDFSNSHGHYFDCYGDSVTLFKPVEQHIRNYKKYFID